MNLRSCQGACNPNQIKLHEKVLTSVKKGIYVKNRRISSEEIRTKKDIKWHIEKKRLQGGRADGVDIVEVDNGRLSFVVVPTRGMGIWKGKFDDCFLGWDSPVKGVVHPNYVNLEGRGGLGWLDGFNEWVVRCGLESNGAPGEDVIIDNMGNEKRVRLPLHGRIANIPASEVDVYIGLEAPFELGVKGVVYEQTMFGCNLKMSTTVTTTIGSNWMRISDVVENIGGKTAEMQLLYHCNYGMPFLEEAARIIMPIRQAAPRDQRASEGMESFSSCRGPEAGYVEQVYFFDLLGDEKGRTQVMLKNRDGTKATSVSFSLKQLPYFTVWKNTASLEDGYVVGLEPGTNFPNTKRFEREKGRVVKLESQEKYAVEVTFAVHIGKIEVQNIERQIEKLQGSIKPKIFSNPVSEFSPGPT